MCGRTRLSSDVSEIKVKLVLFLDDVARCISLPGEPARLRLGGEEDNQREKAIPLRVWG